MYNTKMQSIVVCISSALGPKIYIHMFYLGFMAESLGCMHKPNPIVFVFFFLFAKKNKF